MTESIAVALIGLAGVILTAVIGLVKVHGERHKADQAISEMSFTRAALGFPEFVEEWGEISADLLTLFDETEVDRFLILRAWNGHLDPRWTTALYQVRKAGQTPIAYVHFELDKDYVSMLREVTMRQSVYLDVENMPQESFLRDVYKAEGVTGSLICHLATHEIEGSKSKAYTYCSFATHHAEGMGEAAQTRCRVLAGRLKGLADSFDGGIDG